jgi:hypothetical protein
MAAESPELFVDFTFALDQQAISLRSASPIKPHAAFAAAFNVVSWSSSGRLESKMPVILYSD